MTHPAKQPREWTLQRPLDGAPTVAIGPTLLPHDSITVREVLPEAEGGLRLPTEHERAVVEAIQFAKASFKAKTGLTPDQIKALEDAKAAVYETLKVLITLAPILEQPYPDDARWSHWTRWIDRTERTPWKALQRADKALNNIIKQVKEAK